MTDAFAITDGPSSALAHAGLEYASIDWRASMVIARLMKGHESFIGDRVLRTLTC